MKLEQEIINRLAPVRDLLADGKVIQADRKLDEIINDLLKRIGR